MSSLNMLDQKFNQVTGSVKETWKAPQDHFDYGIITSVDYDTYQVKVKLSGRDKGDILPDSYLPLISQREIIFMLWGQLRKGLAVRVHWRGQPDRADWAAVEIIGDENCSFIKQLDTNNEIQVAAHRVTQGGGLPVV